MMNFANWPRTNWRTKYPALARRDPVSADLVKMRYFAGLSMSEAAQALGIPLRTAERLWTFAKTWLHKEISAARS